MNTVSVKGVSFNPQGGNGDCGVKILSPIDGDTSAVIYDEGKDLYSCWLTEAVRKSVLTEIFGYVPSNTYSDIHQCIFNYNKIAVLPYFNFYNEDGSQISASGLLLDVVVSSEEGYATIRLRSQYVEIILVDF